MKHSRNYTIRTSLSTNAKQYQFNHLAYIWNKWNKYINPESYKKHPTETQKKKIETYLQKKKNDAIAQQIH